MYVRMYVAKSLLNEKINFVPSNKGIFYIVLNVMPLATSDTYNLIQFVYL